MPPILALLLACATPAPPADPPLDPAPPAPPSLPAHCLPLSQEAGPALLADAARRLGAPLEAAVRKDFDGDGVEEWFLPSTDCAAVGCRGAVYLSDPTCAPTGACYAGTGLEALISHGKPAGWRLQCRDQDWNLEEEVAAAGAAGAPPADLVGDLPRSWRRLQEREGRLVDYRWCNADPVEVHLPDPGQDQLRWQWGQEEEQLTLRAVTWTDTGARWEVDRGGTPATVTLAWTDKDRGLAAIALGDREGETFVDQARLSDFPSEAESGCDEL